MHLNKDMENESISKGLEEALKSFESKTKQVPAGYFDQFELNIMQKINAAGQVSKRAPIVALFLNHRKYLVAASLVFAIATGILFFITAEKNNAAIAKVEMIDIETLPDELIEAYVINNEFEAELEWNTAIETEAVSFSKNN
jgi:hypothetical protein